MLSARSGGILVAAMMLALACSDDTTTPATSFTADLLGTKEIPANASAGTAHATCTISSPTVSCTITYSGLSGAPTAAHIHSGTASTASGTVRVNLCGAGAAPACPAAASGTITSGAQPVAGITFDALVAQMRQYGAYVNIHTAANPGGEIRGQIFGVY